MKFFSIAILAISLAFPAFAVSKLPNILFILADDVGCEPIGCYGGESVPTPNVDALAAGGMRFEHCYSMPVCHPSRMAIMTGRYPFKLNAKWGSFPKELESGSIGRVMQNAGYATAVAGKWQLALMKKDVQQPARLGFDEWSVFGWHEGARFHDPMIYQNGKVREDVTGKYGPDLYVEFLADFMKKGQVAGTPFFAYYSMALAHDVTDDLKWQVPYVPGKNRWMDYREMVASMDEMVGRLVGAVDKLGIRENTAIFFTGDNGTAARSKLRFLGEEGSKYEYESVSVKQKGKMVRGGKGLTNDRGTHVPLIVNWPGKVCPGGVSQDLVDFTDWLPTFAELAGGQLPETPLNGQSFASSFLGGKGTKRTYAFAESRGGRAFVRDQRYKLYNDGRLLDIPSDAEEKKPLTEGEAGEVRAKLQAAMDALGYGKSQR
jgi:arylsulfatase A